MGGLRTGGMGSIFDDASTSIARGINDGITNALPGVQAAINEVVRNTTATVLPDLQNRLRTAMSDGITQATRQAKDLLSSSTGVTPSITAGIKGGIDAGIAKYKTPLLVVGGILAALALATAAASVVTAIYTVKRKG